MSQQPPSPKRKRCTAARENTSNLLPLEPQPGCSNDSNENEPENDEKNLMILIDDCLLKIFDFLKLNEVGHVAHVNVRLNDLAKYYFQMKYHDVRFEKKFDFISFNGRINAEVAQAFLHIFGNEIEELKLTRESFTGTLDNESMYQIFGSLVQHCSSMKKLTVHGFHMGGLPVDCFGELVEVRLLDVVFKGDGLEKLFKNNRKIKILSIDNCGMSTSAIFSKLPCLKELEEFDYKYHLKKSTYSNSGAFHHLYSLKKLKILKLSSYFVPSPTVFEGFVKSGIAIEHLEFRDGQINDETVSDIVKMRTLKVLKLYNVKHLHQSRILRIVRELKRLEEFHIFSVLAHMTQGILMQIVNSAKKLKCLKIWITCLYDLNVRKFREILSIQQKRYKNNALELTIYGDGLQTLSVPDKILKGENERWLKVAILDRKTNPLYEK